MNIGDAVTIRAVGHLKPHPLDGVGATVAAPLYDQDGVRVGWHLTTGVGSGAYRALDCEVIPSKPLPTVGMVKESNNGRVEQASQATTDTPVDLTYPANGHPKAAGVVLAGAANGLEPCTNCQSWNIQRTGNCSRCLDCGTSGGC